jgi:tRNA A58 N-methylase Trm61
MEVESSATSAGNSGGTLNHRSTTLEDETEKLTLDKLPRKVLKKLSLDTVFMASRVVIAAERLQVFRKLHGRKLSVTAIGKMLGVHRRYLAQFLDALVSLGLLRKDDTLYWNSALAEKHFITERTIFWTRQFSSECVEDFEGLTVLEAVLRSGKDCWSIMGKKKQSYIESMKRDPQHARDFTQMLYHIHKEDAKALADHLDLSGFHAVLDVAGGSGVMSMALARENPHIQACVLDIGPVCRVARELIKKEGLSRRVRTLAGNMYDRLPAGYDVVMYCDIGTVGMRPLRLAHKSLPTDGMVVLVDRFMSVDGTEPLDRLLRQFTGSWFGLETRGELVSNMRRCGFKSIKRRNIGEDVWMITGRKK